MTIDSPPRDSLRSAFLWLALLLFLLRKSNRNRQAWAIVPALGVVLLIFHVAESQVNTHVGFYWDRYASQVVCEMLRCLAMAIAVLLALSDLIALRGRLWRFLLVFLILFAAGAASIGWNAPLVWNRGALIVVFGIFLVLFLLGHALLRTLLRGRGDGGKRSAGRPANLLARSTKASLLLGIAPVIALAIGGSILTRSTPLISTIEVFRMVILLSHALLGPYFVLFWFLLLGLLIPLYRQRLAPSFGYPAEAGG